MIPTEIALGGVVDRLLSSVRRDECVTAVHTVSPQEARYAEWPVSLHPRLLTCMQSRGIHRLYTHQAQAIEHVHAGRNVVVVTPTASGKTLCYNLPVLDAMLRDSDACALYLFPTKALAQDQLAELQETVASLEESIGIHTFDGDTPDDARRAIRSRARVVLTNPDMLHSGILPFHARWSRFFQNLRYVVIDELHTYRGVFGSHLCNVLRRLRRVCAFHQANHFASRAPNVAISAECVQAGAVCAGQSDRPAFVMCSATIANPAHLAARLTESAVELVEQNGAPRGRKDFIFYNPPVVDATLGIRRSCINQARWIASRFLGAGVQTIVFTTSRQNTEVLTRYLKEDIERRPDAVGSIRAYRGGYLPSTRREIERGLRNGEISGVVSTNALELGIDIGMLDVAVLAGYPGSVASTWQQAGRAGRRSDRSVALLVARSEPMDQFIITHPEYFFERSPEQALINPDNLLILLSQIKCAPSGPRLARCVGSGGEKLVEILAYLTDSRVLQRHGNRWHWALDVYPADGVSLRSISTENFVVMDASNGNRVLAEVDYRSAPSTLYEDAIYLCETESYNVSRLDYKQRRAYVRKVDVDYYTEAISHTSVKILETFESAPRPVSVREHGDVHVVWRVSGFKKMKFHTRENVGYGEVNLPDQEMHTTASWLTIKPPAWTGLSCSRADVLDGVIGLAFLLHHMAPLHLMCDISDIAHCVGDLNARWFTDTGELERGRLTLKIREAPPTDGAGERNVTAAGTELAAIHALDAMDVFEPTIYLYDNFPGGIGFSAPLFDALPEILRQALDCLNACPCEVGCPSCVGPINEVGTRSKAIAQALAARLLV